MNKKFIDTVKIYLLNSSLYCLNDLVGGSFLLLTTKTIYENPSFDFNLSAYLDEVFYFCYVRTNITSLLYTFSGFMDVYIAFGRFQAFKPDWKFLRNTPVSTALCSKDRFTYSSYFTYLPGFESIIFPTDLSFCDLFAN